MLTEERRENAPAQGDVNFNSPGHHSSQDGSFIQDEAGDMHLILDFNPSHRSPLKTETLTDYRPSRFQPTSVLSSSWIRHQQAKWATDFDANIAELDFDSVSATREILALPRNAYVEQERPEQGQERMGKFWASIGEECLEQRDWNDNCNVFSLPNLEGPMKGSLELSSGESLFSSAAIESEETAMQLLLNQEQLAAQAGFISTDSLDASAFDPEVLKAACATRKTDYCLTFATSRMNDSCLVPKHTPTTPDNYKDAALSSAADVLEHKETPKKIRLESSACLTTWGRIRRSYDVQSYGQENQLQTPKSTSLPNLGSPVHLPMGAGEQMLSIREVPIFDLTTSQNQEFEDATSKSSRLSLLRAFRDRFNIIPDDDYSIDDDSSGYITAEATTTKLEQISENDNQRTDYQPTPAMVDDYEYAEFYVGNGRYVDINHNEIGFEPPSTTGVQHVNSNGNVLNERTPRDQNSEPVDRWALIPGQLTRVAPTKPPRTFATILQNSFDEDDSPREHRNLRDSGTQVPVYVVDQSVQTATADNGRLVKTVVTTSVSSTTSSQPIYVRKTVTQSGTKPPPSVFSPDLSFMKLAHMVPPLLKSAAQFPLSLLSPNESTLAELVENRIPVHQRPLLKDPAPANQPFCGGTDSRPANFAQQQQVPLLVNQTLMGLPNPPQSIFDGMRKEVSNGQGTGSKQGVTRDRDSGLGASGPAHIQDWDSLATLLPKDVVQACSFFKHNSQLLQKSFQQYRDVEPSSIDKPANFRRQRRPMSECRVPKRRSRFESIREEHPYDGGSTCHYSQRCHSCCIPPPCHHHHCSGVVSTPCYTSAPQCHQCFSHHHYCPPSPSYMEREHSNLTHWHMKRSFSQDSGREMDSSVEYSRDRLRNRPMPQQLSASSSEEDLLNESCYLADTMFSEYQLRERDPAVVPRQFYSLQNVRSVARDASPRVKPCATCFRLRSPSLQDHPPIWAQPPEKREVFCDCETSDILELKEQERRRFRRRRPGELHPDELAVRNTPVYRRKKDLIDGLTRICDDLVNIFSEIRKKSNSAQNQKPRNNSVWELIHNSLCPVLAQVVADGIQSGYNVWMVVQASATLGPATKSVHELVTDLSAAYGQTNGEDYEPMQFRDFVEGLLKLRSLDCWMSYLILKDKLLEKYYSDGAFLRRALTAYRTLFDRLIMAIQPLSLLPFHVEYEPESPRRRFSLIPTRLPSDSRVPKSSSIPSKLSANAACNQPKSSSVDTGLARMAKRSKIPILMKRKTMKRKNGKKIEKVGNVMSISDSAPIDWEHEEMLVKECQVKRSATKNEDELRLAAAIESVSGNEAKGLLGCRQGEGLEVVSKGPGFLLRCRKTANPKIEGLIPRNKVTFVSLL